LIGAEPNIAVPTVDTKLAIDWEKVVQQTLRLIEISSSSPMFCSASRPGCSMSQPVWLNRGTGAGTTTPLFNFVSPHGAPVILDRDVGVALEVNVAVEPIWRRI